MKYPYNIIIFLYTGVGDIVGRRIAPYIENLFLFVFFERAPLKAHPRYTRMILRDGFAAALEKLLPV